MDNNEITIKEAVANLENKLPNGYAVVIIVADMNSAVPDRVKGGFTVKIKTASNIPPRLIAAVVQMVGKKWSEQH